MIPLDRLLWRLLVASCGFCAAVVAALATTVVAAVSLAPFGLRAGDPDGGMIFAIFGLEFGEISLAVELGGAVFAGWLIVALLAEVFAVRGLLVHLLAFAGITVAAHLAIPATPDGAVRFAAAVGFVAGFADWLVAGRSAGFRLPSRAPTPRSPGDAP
jgi:hypothetical protein